MLQNFKASTHTAKAFMEFVDDLLGYALSKQGYEWYTPEGSDRKFQKIFKESFGEAIILFRTRHKEEFKERLDECLKLGNDTMEEYAWQFCERTFKGKIPLMELIAYLAFVLDTSVYFFKMEDTDEVQLLVDETVEVFNQFVAPYFTTVGGWHALYRVAEQYVDFVKIASDLVSAAASEDASASNSLKQ